MPTPLRNRAPASFPSSLSPLDNEPVRSIRARLGADLRARWRSTLALVVVIGLAGGTVLATAAGARRTDTAYRRFLQSSRAEDVVLGGVDVSPDALALFRRLKRLPQVAAAAPVGAMIIFAEGTRSPDGRVARRVFSAPPSFGTSRFAKASTSGVER